MMTFRDYLLKRAEVARTRRYLRRSCADDLALDFAQDCAENPDRVPADDVDLYNYLDHRTHDIKLDSGDPVLEWLWHRWLRVGL